MARSSNGTTDHCEITFDLSALNVVTVAFWFFFPTAYNDTLHTFYEYANPNWTVNGFIFSPFAAAAGTPSTLLGFANAAGTNWQDAYPQSSVNTWHHAVCLYDKATPQTAFYLDGGVQSPFSTSHPGATWGNFANSTLNLFSRAGGGSLFGSARIAELAIWAGDARGATITTSVPRTSCALSLSLVDGTPPAIAGPKTPLLYCPFIFGDSPDDDYSGNRHTVAVTGTTKVNSPRTRTTLQPNAGAS